MTEVASRGSQNQSIIDTISRTAPTQARTQHSGKNATRKTPDADTSSDQVGGRFAGKAEHRDKRSDIKSADAATKVAEKPRFGNDTDDDADTSFETTIDTLGSQAQSGDAQAATPSSQAAWNTEALRTLAQNQPSNDDSDDAAQSLKTAAPTGHLLKQASVIALLDARQRLQAVQDAAMPEADASEETIESAMTVHTRESHWVFDTASTESSRRVSDALINAGREETPLAALASSSGKTGGDVVKSSSDTQLAAPSADQVPADGTASRQNFGGAQDGSQNHHSQSGTTGGDTRQILKAATPAEQVIADTPDISVAPSVVSQQVRSGVLAALADENPGASVSSQPQLADRPPVAGQVLKTIDLTLSPPDLGTVRLKLSLKSSALDIDAATSKAATAKLLDNERSGLEQSLRDAGYDVKSLKISDISSTSNSSLNSSLNNGSSSFQDGSQARANFSGRQDDGMSQREGGTSDQSQQRRRNDSQKTSTTADIVSGRPSNAIYI
jgi:hypothetical protein